MCVYYIYISFHASMPHQKPTATILMGQGTFVWKICFLCDKFSAMADVNCFIPGEKTLLEEHAACRLKSAYCVSDRTILSGKTSRLQNNCPAYKVFPQVRSSILAETYNMWKNSTLYDIDISFERKDVAYSK